MKKKVLCTVIVLTMLLAACSSTQTPPASNDATPPVNNEEQQAPSSDLPVAEEKAEEETNNVDFYVPTYFSMFGDKFMTQYLEPHGIKELQENSDGSLSGKISKEQYELYIKGIYDLYTSDLNESISAEKSGCIKGFVASDNLSDIEFTVDSNSYDRVDVVSNIVALPYLAVVSNAPDAKVNAKVKDSTSGEIIDTIEYPNPIDEMITKKLGKSYICLSDAYLNKNFEGKDCITIYLMFLHNYEDPIAFELAMMPKAFQNGVQLDTAYIDSEESKTASKEIQPGYTVVVAKSFLLSDLEHPVDFQIEEFLSMEDTGKVTKTYDIAALAQ